MTKDLDHQEIIMILDELPSGSYKVGINPPHDWQKLAYMLEGVGIFALGFVGKNPKGIDSAEEMAQYMSEYLTKVIMGGEVNDVDTKG